jgi:ABC-type transport system involved in cytochrome bd biosynthesis fused ATPase/permease subunit
MDKAKELREARRKMQKRTDQQNNFQYKKIRIGQGNIQSVIDRKQKLVMLASEAEREWNKLSLLCSMPIIISMILSLLTCKNKPINLVMLCMTMLKSIDFITNFFSSYEDTLAKEDQYSEYWKDKIMARLPVQLPMPDVMHIMEYTFDNCRMWFSGAPVIEAGDLIRLTARTGAGKTTFVNALKGVREGLVLAHHQPLNYFDNIAHLRQDIREAYHFSDISLSELFETRNENIIIELLDVVGLSEWYAKLGSIHTEIKNAISGGQKTQLCLAITMLESVNRQMIIMDEPEQGIDKENVPEILERVFEWLHGRNPAMRIIFISHLCDCVVARLPAHKHWHITREQNVLNMIIE